MEATMMIMQKSFDWAEVREQLEDSIFKVSKDRDKLHTLLNNIEDRVTELNKEEVMCRQRNHQTSKNKRMLADINAEIDHFDQWLLYGMLIGDYA